ncbi:MAG: Rieske 2Fe-2S domain-containing protein [Phycisphaerales bacterium]|nr:Rieske 2Fe-2S domain-containing protein [Phycisphaerales bacterium]
MPEYTTVAQKADIPVGEGRAIEVAGLKLAIFNADGEFFAFEDRCSHADLPICAGRVTGSLLICPWHHAAFDLRTGCAVDGPANGPIKRFNVRLHGDAILVER